MACTARPGGRAPRAVTRAAGAWLEAGERGGRAVLGDHHGQVGGPHHPGLGEGGVGGERRGLLSLGHGQLTLKMLLLLLQRPMQALILNTNNTITLHPVITPLILQVSLTITHIGLLFGVTVTSLPFPHCERLRSQKII